MHRCKSFRALFLFGVVAFVTAFYQSMTPPSSALTVTTGLKSRHSVFNHGPVPIDSDAAPALSGVPSPRHPLSVGPI